MPSYEITVKSAMQWAAAELEHVGRIASMADPDLQYAYAMSTLNGMAHLKDALFELVSDPDYEKHRKDLQKTHDAVVRTMKNMKREYALDLDAIRQFNTRGTLSDLSYLEGSEAGVGAEESYPANTVIPIPNGANVSQDGGRRKTRRRTIKRRKNARRSRRA